MKIKRQALAVMTVLGISAASALAQDSGNPLVNTDKGLYGYIMGNVIAAAEQVPEADYSFKATPDVRSFGQLVGHVADAQYMFCGKAAGEKPAMKGIEKSKTSKDDLVSALKEAEGYCMKVYSGLDDKKAAETVDFMGHPMTKLGILSLNTAHADEHYGNMVTYMRLKGMVPPSSAPRK